jgi:hypothetical protein
MRAALDDERIPVMEMLVAHGANVNAWWDGHYPIIFAPCETLAPGALRWLIAHGADMNVTSRDGTNCVRMLIGTYSRHPQGKHECMEVFAKAGFAFPDTAPMAVHRGRIDLLASYLDREPKVLDRRFSDAEIYPAELGLRGGLTAVPVDGGTLLHVACEYGEEGVARWLIDRGADVNARAAIDADGFGGHTALFHTVVTMGRKDDSLAQLLLRGGADARLRATFRKQLVDMGDPEKERMREYHDVTSIGFARVFQEPGWVNEAAIGAIREYGGR